MKAFVLGNGCSRRGISAAWLAQRGTIFGCNAIYREFTPHVLVATDTAISTEIQKSGYSLNHTFYTRDPLPNLGALELPQQFKKSSSGPNAVFLATQAGYREIYLLGFDMNPHSNRINNIYAGTNHYASSTSYQPSPTGWLADLVLIAQTNPHTRFIRIVGPDSASHPVFSDLPNVSLTPIASFLTKIE